jgi:hypothetical protein
MTANGWIRVVVTSRVEDAGTVDDALEAVGLRHVAHDGEDRFVVVACSSLVDLCSARMACASIAFDSVSREDLDLTMRDAADAERARAILNEMRWIDAEVVVVRTLRVYVRDAATLDATRAEIVARLGMNAAAVDVV